MVLMKYDVSIGKLNINEDAFKRYGSLLLVSKCIKGQITQKVFSMKAYIFRMTFAVVLLSTLLISMCKADEELRKTFIPIRKCNWALCKRPITRHRGGVFGPYRNRPRCCMEYEREREREALRSNVRTISKQ
uniref:Uncharacterized protein n=1 Tax=Syphacia muris TaxID=451379 RepID=A0A0N5B0N4_9BILA